MIRYPLLLALFQFPLLFLVTSCIKTKNIPIESGVSYELASFRHSTIKDVEYHITLAIPDADSLPIPGTSTITFTLAQTLNQPLQIDFSEDSDHILSVEVNGKHISTDHRNEHLIISNQHLHKGVNVINIEFIAGTQALNRKEDFMYTLFVPERARTFMPCFDQPDLKARFKLQLSLPMDWVAVSNGSQETFESNDATNTFNFSSSDLISTYLFSFVAGKFNTETRTINSIPATFYYRESDSTKIQESMDSIFHWHKLSLAFMEDYTGIPYPFKKLDFIAIPDFQFGGMEHVGCIDYKASLLFLDHTATLRQQINRANLIAHETAHMWFGNLVTMKWFDDVWTKEVFANFMADKITGKHMPQSNDKFQFFMEHYPAAYSVDRTRGATPIRQELSNLNKAGSMYGSIIYHKAPIVMRMLEDEVSPSLFQEGLRHYLSEYAYRNATWPNLIEILNPLVEGDMQAWNKTWVDQPGRPRINMTRSIDKDKLHIHLQQESELGNRNIWKQHIGVSLVFDDTVKTLSIPMSGASSDMEVMIDSNSFQFVLLNPDGQGYGSFAVDTLMIDRMDYLEDPLMRISGYINLYESVLNGTIPGNRLLQPYLVGIANEENELILGSITAQLAAIYDQFLSEEERLSSQQILENTIWDICTNAKTEAKRRILYRLYKSISRSKESTARLYTMWQDERGPQGLRLSEQDLIALSAELVIRDHVNQDEIITIQRERIKDTDRKSRFEFSLPALSNDQSVRDAFFDSLSNKDNRLHEEWVLISLSYLHHPLRTQRSEKYLPRTLELLEEIQASSSIFFPSSWLAVSFGNYQSTEAAAMVEAFLDSHPEYPHDLRKKILQATDNLYRASAIVN